MITGRVFTLLVEVNRNANRKLFQVMMKASRPPATRPGSESGSTIRHSVAEPAAAVDLRGSSSSRGRVEK